MSDQSSSSSDYYDVLGVRPSADDREIRKAYLKLSLEHHPDKNPDNQDAAQAAFVRIGQAYQVLCDPVQRKEYDKHRRQGGFSNGTKYSAANGGAGFASGFQSNYATSSNNYSTGSGGTSSQQNHYASYKDAFEATMADLSDDEMQDLSGAAAMMGGIVGTILGSRMFKDHPILREVGPVVASALASQAAATMVKTARTQSKQKALASKERRERVARGEHISEQEQEPPTNTLGEHLKEIIKDLVQHSAKEVGKTIQQAALDMMANNGRKNARQ